ncbi:MAG: hypothetical protein ABFD49_06790 [Armatimonadota bacterium]|nr:hypothetical protein [bacterium]
MASDKGAPKDGMDERLAQARDGALLDGEEIVAQEMGDQGQAIILTNSRILIIKAGLTATGTLNGQSTGAFPVNEITAVNLRKGPMGAVIQICVDGRQQSAQAGPPDNVIVFSGDQRVKKCEIIAEKIESAIRKPLERIEPTTGDAHSPRVDEHVEEVEQTPEEAPKPNKGGRQAKSLAEEMFEEMNGSAEPEPPQPVRQPEPKSVPEPEPVERVAEVAASEPAEAVVEAEAIAKPDEVHAAQEPDYKSVEELGYKEPEEEVEEDNEPTEDFRPNPFLPRPVRKKSRSGRSFTLIGGLMVLALFGVAVISPMRQPKVVPVEEVNVDNLTRNAKTVRRQIAEIDKYREDAAKILAASNKESAALARAVHSGRQAVVAAAGKNASDKAWQELTKLKVPSGLAGARENIVLGTFTRKNAVANALSVGQIDASGVNARLSEANSLIKKGFEAIDKMKAGISNQLKPTSQESKKQKAK